MRLDKYLKTSRLIKRRAVAKNACDAGRIEVNGAPAKPAENLVMGDIITINMGANPIKVKVTQLEEHVSKDEASEMYQVIE